MAPGSVRRIHAILSAALNYAVGWGWIDRNPAEYAHPPKMRKRRPQAPEAEQVAQLINLAWKEDPEFGLFLWLAVTTGARCGELTSPRWSHCKLDRGELFGLENYVVRDGQRKFKNTKTEDDRRLYLDTLTVQMLKDYREAREAALLPVGLTLAPDAFVFSPDPACLRPWHPDHFTHTYREFADQVGIALPLKNLRHFNATQLLAAGVDVPTAAGRLGHSDSGTTLRFYASAIGRLTSGPRRSRPRTCTSCLRRPLAILSRTTRALPLRCGSTSPRPTSRSRSSRSSHGRQDRSRTA